MALLNRQTLKSYFKKGSFPSEIHFAHLIDSMLNIIDDGIGRSADDGFRVTPQGNARRLLSFFSSARDKDPGWAMSLNEQEGLSFLEPGQNPSLHLSKGGMLGIGTASPTHTLDVRGTCAMNSRTGNLRRGYVPADNKWHNIISELDGLQAFEIMAAAHGKPGTGKYAIAHAIAVSTFGGRASSNKIRITNAHYGGFFNKLQFRWTGTLHDYALQVRTRSHFGIDDRNGEAYPISFHITRLWSPEDQQHIPSAL